MTIELDPDILTIILGLLKRPIPKPGAAEARANLSQGDLANCMRVNKAFNHVIIPILYDQIIITDFALFVRGLEDHALLCRQSPDNRQCLSFARKVYVERWDAEEMAEEQRQGAGAGQIPRYRLSELAGDIQRDQLAALDLLQDTCHGGPGVFSAVVSVVNNAFGRNPVKWERDMFSPRVISRNILAESEERIDSTYLFRRLLEALRPSIQTYCQYGNNRSAPSWADIADIHIAPHVILHTSRGHLTTVGTPLPGTKCDIYIIYEQEERNRRAVGPFIPIYPFPIARHVCLSISGFQLRRARVRAEKTEKNRFDVTFYLSDPEEQLEKGVKEEERKLLERELKGLQESGRGYGDKFGIVWDADMVCPACGGY